MKRCSQPGHQAFTELNITPLLDLAFVLLVIFIITTAPMVNDLDVSLPTASNHPKAPQPKPTFITLAPDGTLKVNNQMKPLEELQAILAVMRVADPDLSVVVRGDATTPYQRVCTVLDACRQANVLKVDLATEPATYTP